MCRLKRLGSPHGLGAQPKRECSAIDQHCAGRNTYVRLTLAAHLPQPTGSLTHMGGSASSPEARVSREYRRREAERARRIVNPRRYGSPDALPETEYTPPVRTTQPSAPSPISPKVAPQPEQPAPPQPAPSGMVLIALQVPPGCQPGQIISAQHNGQTIQVACPPGCPPGATFQVQVPASQPVLASVVTT